MKRGLLLIGFSIIYINSYAQFTSKDSSITISTLIDVYYSFQSNEPYTNQSQYTFAYHRHNELNLNVGLIRASYEKGRVRGNLGLQTGTYAQANYAAEPVEYRMINEANVGVELFKNVWLDAGVMPSHIGVESFDATQCYTLTRSLMADGSPYFLTAAKLSYTPSDEFIAAVLVTNGFQRIQETNDEKLFGLQLTYSPIEQLTLNYSNLFGQENPFSDYWFFSDFWIEYRDIVPGFKATLVADYLHQENAGLFTTRSSSVFTSAFLLYYEMDKLGFGGRAEVYQDNSNLIYGTPSGEGFNTMGYSLNADVKITENALFRLEGRYLQADAAIFDGSTNPSSVNTPVINLFVPFYEQSSFVTTAALQLRF